MITTALTTREEEVRNGLQSALCHLDPIWPKYIAIHRRWRILVNNIEEAMGWFRAVNFIDCRISAYPKHTDGIAPTVLVVDHDEKDFQTHEEFEICASRIYTNFDQMLGGKPTQIWSGGGYHYVQPQSTIVFENNPRFKKFDQPSRRFMQFEEQLLTDSNGDPSHWGTVSFNNCTLRIPGSFNSKYIQFDKNGRVIYIPPNAEVKVVKCWDGNTPTIKDSLLNDYYFWLQFMIVKQNEQRSRSRYHLYGRKFQNLLNKNIYYGYDYIEKLINKPLDDFREFCIWRVFVPYFINVKGLSRSETFDKVKSWLDRCNSIVRLKFNARYKIDYELSRVLA
jgi:hypothetical protein